MKRTILFWTIELTLFTLVANSVVSCQLDRWNSPKPSPIYYPDIIETQPRLTESAMEELNRLVEEEINKKAKEYAMK